MRRTSTREQRARRVERDAAVSLHERDGRLRARDGVAPQRLLVLEQLDARARDVGHPLVVLAVALGGVDHALEPRREEVEEQLLLGERQPEQTVEELSHLELLALLGIGEAEHLESADELRSARPVVGRAEAGVVDRAALEDRLQQVAQRALPKRRVKVEGIERPDLGAAVALSQRAERGEPARHRRREASLAAHVVVSSTSTARTSGWSGASGRAAGRPCRLTTPSRA